MVANCKPPYRWSGRNAMTDGFYSLDFGKSLRFVDAISSSSCSLMESAISLDAPLSSDFFVSPRFAAEQPAAQPSASLFGFCFHGSSIRLSLQFLADHVPAPLRHDLCESRLPKPHQWSTIRPVSSPIGLGRAAGGSILFTVSILMTMEMWWLGFYMDPLRLALMLLVSVPILSGLAYHSGFQKRISIQGAVVDAMVALAVGAVMAATILLALAIINDGTSLQEAVGKITIPAVPEALGRYWHPARWAMTRRMRPMMVMVTRKLKGSAASGLSSS